MYGEREEIPGKQHQSWTPCNHFEKHLVNRPQYEFFIFYICKKHINIMTTYADVNNTQ